MSNKAKIIIIGGGASGMTAAIAAARMTDGVVILEALPRVGKKLLATGNGRCNVSNSDISPEHYRSDDISFTEQIFKILPKSDALSFLSSVGIECFEEREGRIYPRSEQAATVLDMLRLELEHLGVTTHCDTRVSSIMRKGEYFLLHTNNGTFESRHVILACGSMASPQLGGCSDGIELARPLGHKAKSFSPALSPIPVKADWLKSLKGVRAVCRLTLCRGDKPIYSESGELQFNENTLSGIVAFQISSRIVRLPTEGCSVCIDLMPYMSKEQLLDMLKARRRDLGHLSAWNSLAGIMNKKLALCILKLAGGISPSDLMNRLSDRQLTAIADTIKLIKLEPTGQAPWAQAQTASGGLSLGGIGFDMQSKHCKGLYICGEVLDCDGDCGGFNLQWAWSSGIIAGRSAASDILASQKREEVNSKNGISQKRRKPKTYESPFTEQY